MSMTLTEFLHRALGKIFTCANSLDIRQREVRSSGQLGVKVIIVVWRWQYITIANYNTHNVGARVPLLSLSSEEIDLLPQNPTS